METADVYAQNTSEEINRRIDQEIVERVREYAKRSRSDILAELRNSIGNGTWSDFWKPTPRQLFYRARARVNP